MSNVWVSGSVNILKFTCVSVNLRHRSKCLLGPIIAYNNVLNIAEILLATHLTTISQLILVAYNKYLSDVHLLPDLEP